MENFIFYAVNPPTSEHKKDCFLKLDKLGNKERHLDCNINSIFLKKKYYENIIQGSSFFFSSDFITTLSWWLLKKSTAYY